MKKWLSAIAILVAMCLVVIVVQQNKISELRGGRPIDLSQAPLPSSGKTITAEEFKKEIFNVFTGGWRGFERERTVPTKEDVESFLDFAKPGITIETEKVLVLYASMLSINAWRESTIGLFLDDGDRCIAIFTTEGWYMIDPQLRLSELPSFYPCGLDVAL